MVLMVSHFYPRGVIHMLNDNTTHKRTFVAHLNQELFFVPNCLEVRALSCCQNTLVHFNLVSFQRLDTLS